MPLDEQEKLILAEWYRSPGTALYKRMLKEARAEYAAALGKHLCSDPDGFNELEHKAQLRAFKLARGPLAKAATIAGAVLAPDDQEAEAG